MEHLLYQIFHDVQMLNYILYRSLYNSIKIPLSCEFNEFMLFIEFMKITEYIINRILPLPCKNEIFKYWTWMSKISIPEKLVKINVIFRKLRCDIIFIHTCIF